MNQNIIQVPPIVQRELDAYIANADSAIAGAIVGDDYNPEILMDMSVKLFNLGAVTPFTLNHGTLQLIHFRFTQPPMRTFFFKYPASDGAQMLINLSCLMAHMQFRYCWANRPTPCATGQVNGDEIGVLYVVNLLQDRN